MNIKTRSCYVPDGQHGQRVTIVGVHIGEVEGNVDRDEDPARDDGNSKKQPTEETKESQEYDSIEANLVEEVGFLGVKEGRDPRKMSI